MAEQLLPIRAEARLNDAARTPAPGARLLYVETGTMAPAVLWADAACTVPLPNPLIADGTGVFVPAWIETAEVLDAILTDAAGGAIDTLVAVPRFGPTSTAASGIAVSPSDGVPETNVQDALAGLGVRLDAAVEGTRPIETGGTGGRSAAEARSALGLGSSASTNFATDPSLFASRATTQGWGDLRYDRKSVVLAPQVITSAGQVTVAHGLTAAPTHVSLALVPQGAQLGYPTGVRVPASGASSVGGVDRLTGVYATATDVIVRYSNAAACFAVAHATTGVATAIVNADWRLAIIVHP